MRNNKLLIGAGELAGGLILPFNGLIAALWCKGLALCLRGRKYIAGSYQQLAGFAEDAAIIQLTQTSMVLFIGCSD